MSYSVKTSNIAMHMAELQNMLNEDIEAGIKTKGFPCADVISSLEKPETIRCGAEMLKKTILCKDCHALYKAAEVRDLKKNRVNEPTSIWQRMVNYVRQHPKLATAIGVGASLALIDTIVNSNANRALSMSGATTTSPTLASSTGSSLVSSTDSFLTSSTNPTIIASSATTILETPEIKCKNGQVFLLDIKGHRASYSTDFVQIAKTKMLAYEYPINLLRVRNNVEQTDQRCHFLLDNVYPSRGTEIKFMNSGVRDISNRFVISREGQGAIVARSANDHELLISMNENCDIPSEFKNKCRGFYPEDKTIQIGTAQGFFKSVPKATTALNTTPAPTSIPAPTVTATQDFNTTSPQALNTASVPDSNLTPNSQCENGQVFLVDIKGDRGVRGHLPWDSIKITKDGAEILTNLFRREYYGAAAITQADQSCHFLLNNHYPANDTQLSFVNSGSIDTSSEPLIFREGQGAIVAKSTNSTDLSISFADNCDIPAEYEENCTGIFLGDAAIQEAVVKNAFLVKA